MSFLIFALSPELNLGDFMEIILGVRDWSHLPNKESSWKKCPVVMICCYLHSCFQKIHQKVTERNKERKG